MDIACHCHFANFTAAVFSVFSTQFVRIRLGSGVSTLDDTFPEASPSLPRALRPAIVLKITTETSFSSQSRLVQPNVIHGAISGACSCAARGMLYTCMIVPHILPTLCDHAAAGDVYGG